MLRRRSFNWKAVWKNSLRSGSTKVGSDDAKQRFQDTSRAHQKFVASLVAAYVDGRIDDDTFASELATAKRDMRADLDANKSAKQLRSAANAFFASIERSARDGATRR